MKLRKSLENIHFNGFETMNPYKSMMCKVGSFSMCKKILLAIALSAAVSTAHGADLRGTYDSAASYGSTWTGIYAGVGVGYGAYEDIDERFPVGNQESSGADLALSVHAGFNYQVGDVVYGVEGDLTKLQSTFEKLPVGFPLTQLRINDVYSLRGRVGYDMGAFLPYVTAGAGYANTNVDDLDGYGYVGGVGVDYKVRDNLVFGVQYVHHKYYDFGGDPIEADFDLFTARFSGLF